MPYYETAPVCSLGFNPGHSQEHALRRSERREKYGDRWNEMKQMAIEHLRSCSGSGPKVLRTVVLDHDKVSGTHFHFVAGTEEIRVCM